MKNSFKILIKSPKFISGMAVLLLVLAFSLGYPIMNREDPFEMKGMAFMEPSSQFLLGTDNFGRDVLLEMTYGTKTSLTVGLISGLVATLLGLVIGLLSGYKGGLLDEILSSITNMFTIIPSFIILILISVSISTKSILLMSIVIGVTSWPWTSRAVRAQTVSLRNRDHVNLARLSGFGTIKIIVYEIFPYIASYVVMAFIIQLAGGILSEASVSMLGLGPSNTISLGVMLNWAVLFEAPMNGSWWTFLPPAAVIGLVTFSLYLMNLGMDEIFNPKIRS